jgi:hypothetical protein
MKNPRLPCARIVKLRGGPIAGPLPLHTFPVRANVTRLASPGVAILELLNVLDTVEIISNNLCYSASLETASRRPAPKWSKRGTHQDSTAGTQSVADRGNETCESLQSKVCCTDNTQLQRPESMSVCQLCSTSIVCLPLSRDTPLNYHLNSVIVQREQEEDQAGAQPGMIDSIKPSMLGNLIEWDHCWHASIMPRSCCLHQTA